MGAYLYGDLAPEEMRDLRLHTQDCAICREDLAARGRIVSSLADTTPELTDADRQRIAWSVKGAVSRRDYQERPLILRLAPGLALAAGVLIAGFALGRVAPHHAKHVASSRTPSSEQVVPGAHVEVTEKTKAPSDKTDDTVKKAIELLNAVSTANGGAPIRQTGPGSRGAIVRPHPKPQPDTSVKMTSDSGDKASNPQQPNQSTPKESDASPKKTEVGTDTDQNKLPKVTDPKNAETTPSESQ